MPKTTNFKQELTGAFGQPIAENPTQAMIEAAYRHHGLDWRYLTIEVSATGLADAVRGARAMGFRGFNCTIPHKVSVIAHLDGLGESASVMGAVNCVVRKGDKLIGENTDGKGFVKSFQESADPKGKKIVLFGAGGAARAISVEMALAGAPNFVIVNRNESRARELLQILREKVKVNAEFAHWNSDYDVPADADVVINATCVGLYPDVNARLAINVATLKPGMIVSDVIFNPANTRLIRDAAERGCKVIDGLGMLVNQGRIGVQHWTGIDPDASVMRRALEDVFRI
jgi:shikimate dehydrogenase